MSSKSNQGFTNHQIQVLSDWVRSQDQPFDNLNLPIISQHEIDTESILLSLGIDPGNCLSDLSGLQVGVARILLRDISVTFSMGFDQ